MSNLYITEFSRSGNSDSGQALPVGHLPAVAEQRVVYTTSSVQSAAFNANTRFVWVHTDAACYVLVGSNPTALSTSMRLAQDSTEYFSVKPGDKIAVIGNA